jgi:D-3-phosphoglycerate dehydrogenase
MTNVCLIVQPIHPRGEELLLKSGLTPQLAPSADMETVTREIPKALAVITRSAGLSAAAMNAATKLRVIASHGVGYNSIDVNHATTLGIPVINTPGANKISVAEHTIALLLAAAKRLVLANQATRLNNFDFKYYNRFSELNKKVLGIIGFGEIGRKVAAIAKGGFDMRIIVYSEHSNPDMIKSFDYEAAANLEDLLRCSDFISLHRPFISNSPPLIGVNEIRKMKNSAILINTARGALIDEIALAESLKEERIAGAALDVFINEDLPSNHPLLDAPNLILTPHIAGSTEQALERTAVQAVEGIISVFNGKPLNVVNNEVWDKRRKLS